MAGEVVDAVAGNRSAIAAVTKFQTLMGLFGCSTGNTAVQRLLNGRNSTGLTGHLFAAIPDFGNDITPEKQEKIADGSENHES